MIKVPGGKYNVGTNDNIGHEIDNEGPKISVTIESFYMDKTAVTNREFNRFVEETGYVTEAEKWGNSFVFYLLLEDDTRGENVHQLEWWMDIKGANWRNPFGDKRSFIDILDHPVVHVTQLDALMFCQWAKKRLPTEIEWVIAAKGGTDGLTYPWGNQIEQDGEHHCNVWQGNFPFENTLEDGYLGTAPVDAFYENDYGLKQMIGNVWEMCSNQARISLSGVRKETLDEQFNTYHKNEFIDYAVKGGSFLCHKSYCNRYRLAARNGIDKLTSASNKGFRCVKDIE